MAMKLQDRSLQDMLAEERQMRSLSDQARSQYAQLLQKLAQQLLGERLEEVRRDDPQATQTWSASQWERFFAQFDHRLPQPPSTWNRSNGKEVQMFRKKLDQAQTEIAALKVQIASLKQEAQKKPFAPTPRAKPSPRPKPSKLKSEPPKKKNRPTPDDKKGNPLMGFATPQKPLAFEATFRESDWTSIRWRRGAMMLYLIATRGINAHLEFDMFIAPVEGLSYRTNSTKKPLQVLAQSGFVEAKTLWIKRKDFRMALSLAHLTEQGQELCRMLGWEPVESEWERLQRLHEGERFEEHTLAVLYFALHARLRGWMTVVMPEVRGTVPDVGVRKDGVAHLVEVELGKKDSPAKWRKLAQASRTGGVAICGLAPDNRKRLVGDCKLAKIEGVATDLHTLQNQEDVYSLTQETPLWLESW